jgi:hypothetical protein
MTHESTIFKERANTNESTMRVERKRISHERAQWFRDIREIEGILTTKVTSTHERELRKALDELLARVTSK